MLLVATGATSASDFTSNTVQYYEKNRVTGDYVSKVSEVCNPEGLPQASSLGIGITAQRYDANGQWYDSTGVTIFLCDGYTDNGVRECYSFVEGQGLQVTSAVRVPDIPNGGHSVFLSLKGGRAPLWWTVANTQGGPEYSMMAQLSPSQSPGRWLRGLRLPDQLNVVCFMNITGTAYVFLSGIPVSSASTGNKNWLIHKDLATWLPLQDSREKRLGGSCGVLQQHTNTTGSDNATVIVMAGGLRSSSSEYLRIPTTTSESGTGEYLHLLSWQAGPDVEEERYAGRNIKN